MSQQEIENFNKAIISAMPQVVVALSAMPDSLDKNALRQKIAAERMPRGKERYARGIPVSESFYDSLEKT